MKDLYIIGAGGVGEEVTLMVETINKVKRTWYLKGFVDDNTSLSSVEMLDALYPVYSFEELLKTETEVYAVIAIADPLVKEVMAMRLKRNKNIKFATLIHPSVPLNRTIKIGEGSIIYPHTILTTNIEIGSHVLLSPKVGIGHGTRIGDFSSLLWNVNISGNVILERCVYIGSSATILQNLVVSDFAVVGASALVTKDVDSCLIVAGVPAKVLR